MTARHRALLPVFLAVLFVATGSSASESYPRTMQQALDMSCPPDCTLCHTRPSGGALTANTPVGISTRRAGLKCCDTSQLLDVIATLETNATDSDADGTPDVDELRAGNDPNALEGKMKCLPPEADEGCSVPARSSSRSTTAPLVLGAALALTALARRRGSRRLQRQ